MVQHERLRGNAQDAPTPGQESSFDARLDDESQDQRKFGWNAAR